MSEHCSNNYFRVGFGIVKILESITLNNEKLFKKVEMLQSLNDVKENRQVTPCAIVIFDGYSVTDTSGRGKATSETQDWTVVIALSDAKAQIAVTELLEKLGDIKERVQTSLQGETVANLSTPLIPKGRGRAGYSTAFTYLPMTFQSEIKIINRKK